MCRKWGDLKEKRRKIVQEVWETKERIIKLVTGNGSIGDVVADRFRSLVHILRVFQVEIWCALKDWKWIPPIVEVTFHATISPLMAFFKWFFRKFDDLTHKGLTLLNP
jgi:hypothetical protein